MGNPDRDRQIYPLWKQGYKIEEISKITGIPKSSVGWYVKQYKNGVIPKKSDTLDFVLSSPEKDKEKYFEKFPFDNKKEPQEKTGLDRLLHEAAYLSVTDKFTELVAQDRYHEAKEMCEAFLAFNELTSFLIEGTKGENNNTSEDVSNFISIMKKVSEIGKIKKGKN